MAFSLFLLLLLKRIKKPEKNKKETFKRSLSAVSFKRTTLTAYICSALDTPYLKSDAASKVNRCEGGIGSNNWMISMFSLNNDIKSK